MNTRYVFALLVVLALSFALCTAPAGSATLQRSSASDQCAVGGAVFKDGDEGEDIDGDDDRWGNTTPAGDPDNPDEGGDPEAGDGGGEVNGDEDLQMGKFGLIVAELRALFGLLVRML